MTRHKRDLTQQGLDAARTWHDRDSAFGICRSTARRSAEKYLNVHNFPVVGSTAKSVGAPYSATRYIDSGGFDDLPGKCLLEAKTALGIYASSPAVCHGSAVGRLTPNGPNRCIVLGYRIVLGTLARFCHVCRPVCRQSASNMSIEYSD
ncbi:hypothetical protein EVAR_53942_1 [Eumeta japonica]|uniref:Uncharacterized protein n=1 Tax=Eumeta variegata TaxID=151549 RepID=A0A4C1ZAV6_EUMVA|nr:hypothetical protein EVAR_53942_1 [Eumeta japonica]